LDLLAQGSMIISGTDTRHPDPFGQKPPGRAVTLSDMVESFLGVDCLETSVLVSVIAELRNDGLLRSRVEREVKKRGHAVPPWVLELSRAEVVRVTRSREIIGDDDAIGVQLFLPLNPKSPHLTLMLSIDHVDGGVAADGLIMADTISNVAAVLDASGPDPYTTWDDIDPADARAMITEAIAYGAVLFPPIETPTWPMCRPLFDWVAGLLPPNGKSDPKVSWTNRRKDSLVKQFLGSTLAKHLPAADRRDHEQLLDFVVDFGTEYGTGNPTRWSENRVDMFLTDWVPRKVMAPPEFLAKLPPLLSAFISYVHEQSGIPEARTSHVLDAIELLAPDLLEAAADENRLDGAGALMAALDAAYRPDGSFDPSALIGQTFGDSFGGAFGFPAREATSNESRIRSLDRVLREIEESVGGADVLASLDTVALPDEPFDWVGIEPDIAPVVSELLELTDRCSDELFDVEFRTAVRRFLAQAAVGDATVFRRNAKANIGAAALIWAVGKANDAFSADTYGVKVGDLVPHFALSSASASQRALSYIQAAGYGRSGSLQSADFLVAAQRKRILDRHLRITNQRAKYE
jgi:Domain of unknown function (DUF6398)